MEKVKKSKQTVKQLEGEIEVLLELIADYEQWLNTLVKANKWSSKDGTVHEISKMSNSHIINCLKMIKRENYRMVYQPLFEAEVLYRQKQIQGTIDMFTEELNKLKEVYPSA